jgi:hypothetical protein
MTASIELTALLKQAREKVNRWESWQRSTDPQGAEVERNCSQPRQSSTASMIVPPKVEA